MWPLQKSNAVPLVEQGWRGCLQVREPVSGAGTTGGFAVQEKTCSNVSFG